MAAKQPTQPTTTESQEQQALFRWADFQIAKHPELAFMYHVPNEGKRTRAAGGRLKAEGLKRGVPDICLPVAKSGYHGLYIELKTATGKVTADQKRYIDYLAGQGYYSMVCRGWEEAACAILCYLSGRFTPREAIYQTHRGE